MPARPTREPERTCVECRLAASKRDLLRFVRAADGSVVVDRSGRAPGRGAYVHRDEGCVTGALRRGGLARSLRARLDASQAARLVDEAMKAVRETA